MSEMLLSSLPDSSATVAIEVIPVADEENDLDTLAFIQHVCVGLRQELAHLEGYAVTLMPKSKQERGLDIVLFITIVSAAIVSSKDLLNSIFNLVTAVVELLAKRNHVQEIEIIIGSKTMVLKDLSKKTAQELIVALAAQHPDVTTTLTPRTQVQVKARISKKRRTKN